MNVAFNLNYLLVFGLLICIVILVYILIKHIFVTENSLQKKEATVSSSKENEFSVPSNIDFFKKHTQIINKSNIITHKENNITYQFIDLGDKILIMEESFFTPDQSSIEAEKAILNEKDIVLNFESDNYVPDNSNISLVYENSILNEPVAFDLSNETNQFIESEAEKIQNEIANSVHDYAINVEEGSFMEDLNAEFDEAERQAISDLDNELNKTDY
ncbi:hypothetical protein B0A67_24015 [Flavobacterium aquidurense]|uniref:hypothetical protein n=1 Tax=Flavobacterium aquidurense TaxID=362413 RepID=UPI00091A53B1|nr:hypothetical protein [Flavobacterium aquidurense]OXA65951.1 hypothetical protein B0A67_24015 [Flavobacterium aquidurense]SHH85158.1 hypothetical protein SAMN05444481_13421 [Flavobacterium frigidimaris]